MNTLGFWREETIELELPTERGRLPLVTDGQTILPVQVSSIENYADGSPKRVRLVLSVVAPPLGYRALWVTYDRGALPTGNTRAPAAAETSLLRNGRLEICFAPRRGTICRILDRESDIELLPINAGRVTLARDTGTLYLAYQPRFARRREFTPRRVEVVESGPIRAALRFTGKIGRHEASLTYRLSCAGRRIDAEFSLDLAQPYCSLDLHWPLPRDHARTVHEIPYGELARDHLEYPALNYADLEGRKHGLAVLNRGTSGHRIEKGALMMRLMRSSDKIHFHDSGPGALSLGRHTFHYSFYPHGGDARQALVWRRGQAFNAPFIVHQAGRASRAAAEAAAPPVHQMLTLRPDNIEVGAFYRDDEGIVLRLVERGGKDTAVEFKPHWTFGRVEVTDFLGRPAREVEAVRRGKQKGLLRLDFRAWEIKTLLFR